ncbi:MAG: hypothetical protein ABW022_17630 [Actinoplanes sp.]
MPALAIPAFALTWWAACYLIGRDPGRKASWRAAAALGAYAIGVAVWTVAPGSTAAEVLICVPALMWAGTAVAMLPVSLPERRQIDLAWGALSAALVVAAVLLPHVGRLIVLVPLAGGLLLLWRFRDQVQPPMLPAALTVAAGLYAAGLAALLLPLDLQPSGLLLAAIGVDLLILAFLVAVAEAIDVGDRLRPDLLRSVAVALGATVLAGGPAVFTILASPDRTGIAVLQFVLVGVVVTVAALSGPIRRWLDGIAFWNDDRLRQDRSALLLLADALPRHRQRHRLITTSEEDFLRFTRQALDNYSDLGRLVRSPLTDLPAVDQRLTGRASGQPLGRAVALRTVLQEGVERLRPAGPFDVTDDWRYFIVLHYCTVLGLDPYGRRRKTDGLDRDAHRALDWMRRYVPRRVLRRWQIEGSTLVGNRLWKELGSTDPRWLSRLPAGKRPSPTRST